MAEPDRGRTDRAPVRRWTPAAIAGRARAGGARFTRDTRGSTAMEYALIGSLIFVVAAGSIRYYGSRMVGVYSQITTTVTQAN
jgi:pilus assembly protein Flp/PilA